MSRRKQSLSIPDIEEGMCGTCRHWHLVGDDELGMCAMLAVVHRKGELIRRKLPIRDTTWMGALERMVYERTMAKDDGTELRREGEGEVVAQELWTGVPRKYVDAYGEEHKVWSPLRTYAWGACSRWNAKEEEQEAEVSAA